MYKYHATNLIAATFDEKGFIYSISLHGTQEAIIASFPIHCGPGASIQFVSTDNNNDVGVRIYGLIGNIPDNKYSSILEACNSINMHYRYIKLYVDEDGDVIVANDFPMSISDECIGEVAIEIFLRISHILNDSYTSLAKAVYQG